MYYLSVTDENFCFKHNKINEIFDCDVEISNEVYHKFFEEQEKGKQFKVKNKFGQTFEEIFEEV